MDIEIEKETFRVPEPMGLWDKHFKTDPAATKKVNKGGGRSITAIDAYHQIKEATQEWGPMGKQWGMRNVKTYTSGDLLILEGEFFHDGGSFSVLNTASMYMGRGEKRRIDDEVGKKIYTDTLTKALSYLGFNADVFFGLFDSNKYVEERTKEVAEKKAVEIQPLKDEGATLLDLKRKEGIIDQHQYEKMLQRLSGMTDPDEITRAIKIIEGLANEETPSDS